MFSPKSDPKVILPAGVNDISPSTDGGLLLRAPESGVSKDATVPADGAEAFASVDSRLRIAIGCQGNGDRMDRTCLAGKNCTLSSQPHLILQQHNNNIYPLIV